MALQPHKKHFVAAIASLSLSAAFIGLSGCGQPVQRLGSTSDDELLRGTVTYTELFNGASSQGEHVTIEGYALITGERYSHQGSVTIRGDFPEGARLDVTGGKVTIDGNVGNNARISVSLPVRTETNIVMMPVANGNNGIRLQPMPQTTVIGLLYTEDTDPAITINGSVGDDVRLSTNAGIRVQGSIGENLRYSTGWRSPFETAPSP